MPIPVTCNCGQSFAAGDHLAGRTVQCPKCKSALTIPLPHAAAGMPTGGSPLGSMGGGASIFDDAGMKTVNPGIPTCPSCSTPLKPNAVLCVNCGYHLQLGRRVGNQPPVRAGGGHDGHADTAQEALSRAAQQIDEDAENSKKEYSQGMPWWAIAGILVLALSFLAAMLYLPSDEALAWGGITIMGVCGLVQLYHQIRILIIAFNDNVGHGLACLFIPCYMLVYCIMKWDECGGHFIAAFVAGLIGNIFGWGMVAAAPYMKPGENNNLFVPPPPAPVVLVMTSDDFPPRVLRAA
jgi:hypothetical protein